MDHIKRIILVFLIFQWMLISGQSYNEMIYQGENDFYAIQQEAEKYFEGKTKGKGSGFKQYKRWENYWISRLDANGLMTNQSKRKWGEYQKLQKTNTGRETHGNWEDMGPHDYTLGYGEAGGNGRVSCMAFHPTNTNIIYIGTPLGGLWKTTNGGSSWTPLTNGIPSIGISSVAIHPVFNNTIYILTGDGDGSNCFSIGVLKSTDGGLTWLETGYSFTQDEDLRGYKMIMHPEDPNILFLATDEGIIKTTDGFQTFQNVKTGWFTDIEFRPGQPDTMYAARAPDNSTKGGFYRTLTGGGQSSWLRNFNTVLDT